MPEPSLLLKKLITVCKQYEAKFQVSEAVRQMTELFPIIKEKMAQRQKLTKVTHDSPKPRQ